MTNVIVNTGRKVRRVNMEENTAFNAIRKSVKDNCLKEITAPVIEACFVKSTSAAVGIVKETQEKKAVGPITNANSTHIALSCVPALGRKALMKHLKIREVEIGTEKYHGLSIISSLQMEDQQEYCTDGVDVDVTTLTTSQIGGLLEEMRNCDLNDDENIKKIFIDLNIIYRLYQEKVIDAAKKMYKVIIEILLGAYRPMSLQPFEYEFDFTAKKIEITQKTTAKKGVELFVDEINTIQVDVAEVVKELLKQAFELEVEMSSEEQKRLMGYMGVGPVDDIRSSVKAAYAAMTAQHQANLAEIRELNDEADELIAIENKRYSLALSKLKNLAGQLLDGYSDEDAASIMHLVACLDKNGVFDARSSNQIATSLLPEKYLNMILNTRAEVKVMGYPVAIDTGLNIGETIPFCNGVAENGSVLDFKNEIEYASGNFRIEEFDGRKYAVKDMTFVSPEADYNKRFFIVKKNSTKDIDALVDSLQEGNTIVVNDLAEIRHAGVKVGAVRCEIGAECDEAAGNTIESLINVRGQVSYLNIIQDEEFGDTVMFELTDIVELEEEEDIMPDVEEIEIEVIGEEIVIEDNLDLDALESELEDEEDLWEDFE